MTTLAELRAAVKHSESLATRKIRRMARSEDGYDVTGTDLDPRKPKGWIDRATRKQLDKYAASLKEFRRPSVGWYKSHNGTPIRRQVIRNAEAAARKRNKRVEGIDAKLAGVKVPWHGGKTYGELRKSQANDSGRLRHINDVQGVRTKVKVKRRARNYSSEKAVIRSSQINREMDSERQVKLRIAQTRHEVMQMLEGEDRLTAALKALTDAQFWFAWTSTPKFSDALKLVYEHNFGGVPSMDIYDNEARDVEFIIRDAKALNLSLSDFWA